MQAFFGPDDYYSNVFTKYVFVLTPQTLFPTLLYHLIKKWSFIIHTPQFSCGQVTSTQQVL
jgi:hypothetical protein